MNPFSSNYIFIPLRASSILTTGYIAAPVIGSVQPDPNLQHFVGPCGLNNQLILYVDFTKGSLTTAELIIEFSDKIGDDADWYQETEDDIAGSTGIITEHNSIRTFSATGKYRIPVPINDNYIRVSVKGTGDVSGSLMKVGAIIGNN